MDDVMLEMNGISKTFGLGTVNEKLALDNVSLKVNKGDFVTIIGSNGAGKSTLFNAIAGSFFTDSGNIILDGKDVTMLSEHKRARVIGRLFQDPMKGTAPGMTIEENLFLAAGRGSWLSKMTKKDRGFFREKLAVLDMGLEDRMNHPVGLLSGGQRQALTLIMATINPPKLMLLDEHTAALDPGTAEKVISFTTRIVKENNLTCMMITHDMEQALTIGNRIFMMNDGNIVFDAANEEKASLTVPDLLEKFKVAAGKTLSNDRMMLS